MNKKRILIVDDDVNAARITKWTLESAGLYEARALSDPTQALLVARDFHPDLILLDVCMPGAEGSEVASELLDDPIVGNTPIVFLTCIVTAAEAGRTGTVKIGAHEYIAKPARADTLLSCVARHLAALRTPELTTR